MFFLRAPFSFPEDFTKTLSLALWGTAEPTETELLRRGKSLQTLWPKLAKAHGGKKEGESHYSELRELTSAYSSYYLPANIPKVPLILEEAGRLGLDIFTNGTRWLDFGTGPGTTLWGLSWWAKAHNRNFQFLGLEQSKDFCATASQLAQNLRSYHPQHQAQFLRFHGQGPRALKEALHEHPADIVSFVNSFHEFFPEQKQKQEAGKALLESLRVQNRRDGKARWLLIVEPASRDNSRQLGEALRFWQDQQLARLWLPCLNSRPCGALAQPKDWCHEAADCAFPSWHENLGKSAGLKKESVLFSYALLSVGEVEQADWPSQAYRMVSQRLEQKGQTECYFCTTEGKVRARVQLSKTTPETESFHQISRGEIFRELELGERGDVQKIITQSSATNWDNAQFPAQS